ncbi:unnamed protein product [Cuscuta campestris]|uniref:GAG-pre-integrase domain-containing protein n=1 Tax=Cuscuta campestris TaxID=132261 RepID=A0A484KXP7_9ASTE|nr:unnamed protein product [Cuscuta campestris]
MCLKFDFGSIVNLKNVRHVPDLSYNLLSCASLENEGLEGKWGKGVMKIMKGSIVVFKAEKKNNLYVCKAEPVCEHANSVVDNFVLWHKRLGHMSNKGLEILYINGHLGSDKLMHVPFCESWRLFPCCKLEGSSLFLREKSWSAVSPSKGVEARVTRVLKLYRVEEYVQPSIVSHSVAHELWSDLKSRYGGSNGPRIHQLKTEMQNLRQKGQSVVAYYNQFITLWNQLYGTKDPTFGCKCTAAALIRADVEHEKTHTFLLGLDDEQYGSVRSQILGTEPVPDISQVYALVAREERHRSIVCARDDRTDAMAFAVGRAPPPVQWQGGRGGGRTGRGGRTGGRGTKGSGGTANEGTASAAAIEVSGSVHSGEATPTSLSFDQVTRLLSMLGPSSSHMSLNGMPQSTSQDRLVDSGASHHMTGTFSCFLDVSPIPPCPVTLPMGHVRWLKPRLHGIGSSLPPRASESSPAQILRRGRQLAYPKRIYRFGFVGILDTNGSGRIG